MSVQAAPAPNYSIPTDHLEQVTRSVAALTIDPYKNAIYYFFPAIGAFFNDYQPLKVDPALEAMMPVGPTNRMLREIQDLTESAGISREVMAHVALNHQFSSYGGSLSVTKPAILIPDQHLFRKNGISAFGDERPGENLRARPWIFSDNETRFLIARELGQIKENSALLRIAIKVTVIVALFTIYASPFGWPMGICLFAGVLGMYVVSERRFQAKADRLGAEILGRRIPGAVQIGLDVLEKMRQQNLFRREHSALAKWYITPSGNNVLDFLHPYLTTRIERLRSAL